MKLFRFAAALLATGFLATAAAQAADAPAGKWTAADVQKLCNGRWPGNQKHMDTCVKRHQKKIGQDKNAKDVKELANPQPRHPKATGTNP